MTAGAGTADCPHCGPVPPRVSTAPVVHCSGRLLIAESADCPECGHRLRFGVASAETCLPGRPAGPAEGCPPVAVPAVK
ncbi:hypothetical protein [Streptomyces sp. NPDC008001]|uniref:hypothetical protein n=1 Tax=Streptomyces sp. NPDC008001 TaxID=3364804 RepID=UPI0036EBF170